MTFFKRMVVLVLVQSLMLDPAFANVSVPRIETLSSIDVFPAQALTAAQGSVQRRRFSIAPIRFCQILGSAVLIAAVGHSNQINAQDDPPRSDFPSLWKTPSEGWNMQFLCKLFSRTL